MLDEYVKLVFLLSDDMRGHAKRRILKVLDEDEESLLCNDLFEISSTPSIVLEKQQEYVPDTRDPERIECWGTDEKFVNFILNKAWYKRLKKEGVDESDIDMQLLRKMIKKIDDKISTIEKLIK